MSEPKEPGSFLRATLQSQPRELARLLADRTAEAAAARLRECRRIFLIGTGTMFRSAGLDAWAVRAFEFANYPPAFRDDDWV